MADFLTKKQRSVLMSKVHGKWTGIEQKMHNYLKSRKVKHRMHPKMEGNPDILLTETRTAVYLDGCFWHGCPRCYKEPKSNKLYWAKKVDRNTRNDAACNRLLRRKGFKVIRLWECELRKDFAKQAAKLH